MFKRLALVAALAMGTVALAGCYETQAQKDAAAFHAFCAKGNNKVEVPECAQLSGGPN